MMTFNETSLKGNFVIAPAAHGDHRGWFMRTYCKNQFQKIGHDKEWVQMNHSFTARRGTVRGLHFQHPPYGEIKMVRCIAGAVFDVAVDIRKDSPTFLKWYGAELSAGNKHMMYIPEGFAHGFQTLSDDVELLYHHSAFYNPQAEGGLLYNDPMINIHWPLPVSELSERDTRHPILDNKFKGI